MVDFRPPPTVSHGLIDDARARGRGATGGARRSARPGRAGARGARAVTAGLRPDDRDPVVRPWPARRERRARAVVEALLAERDGAGGVRPPPAAESARVVREFALWAASGTANVRAGFRLFFLALELLPPFIIGRAARMTRLPLAERVAYLEALERSPVGLLASLVVAVKLPLYALAYENGEALAATGFDRAGISARRLVRAARDDGDRAGGAAA